VAKDFIPRNDLIRFLGQTHEHVNALWLQMTSHMRSNQQTFRGSDFPFAKPEPLLQL
jgi:hypothetical protein